MEENIENYKESFLLSDTDTQINNVNIPLSSPLVKDTHCGT